MREGMHIYLYMALHTLIAVAAFLLFAIVMGVAVERQKRALRRMQRTRHHSPHSGNQDHDKVPLVHGRGAALGYWTTR